MDEVGVHWWALVISTSSSLLSLPGGRKWQLFTLPVLPSDQPHSRGYRCFTSTRDTLEMPRVSGVMCRELGTRRVRAHACSDITLPIMHSFTLAYVSICMYTYVEARD